MRIRRSLVIVMLCVVCMTAMVAAQEGRRGGRRGGGFGFGGGFGGPGGFGGGGLIGLLRMEEVQAEIELDDDQKGQVEALREEMRGGDGDRPNFREMSEEEREKYFAEVRERTEKAEQKLGEILLPHQMERLEQLSVQQRGVGALSDAKVAEKLSITDEQKEQFTSIQEEAREQMGELRELFETDREQAFEKMGEMRRQTEEKILGVLTDEQKKKFEELKGEAFEFPQPQFGGGRGGRGGARRGERPQGEDN